MYELVDERLSWFKMFNFPSIGGVVIPSKNVYSFILFATISKIVYIFVIPLWINDGSYGERLLLDVELPRLSLSIIPWFVIGSMNINFILNLKQIKTRLKISFIYVFVHTSAVTDPVFVWPNLCNCMTLLLLTFDNKSLTGITASPIKSSK